MDTKPFDVFLSHSTKDKHLAAAMKQHLQSRGVRCWMAPDDIRAGESWAAAITRGIQGARVMLLIWSSHSTESAEVTKELSLAMRHRVTVVPYRIADIELPDAWQYHLSDSHWMDALEGSDQENIVRLGDYLLGVLEAGSRPPHDGPARPAEAVPGRGAVPGPSRLAATRPPSVPLSQSINSRSHADSWVLACGRFLAICMPWLNGVGWLWVAILSKSPRDYAYAAAYFLPFVIFCWFNEGGDRAAEQQPKNAPEWVVFLGVVAWLIGIAHAFTERRRILDPVGEISRA